MNTKKIIPLLLILSITIFSCKPNKVAQLDQLRKLALEPSIGRLIVSPARERFRQVLLCDDAAYEVMRVPVALPVFQIFHQSRRCVAQVQRVSAGSRKGWPGRRCWTGRGRSGC